jgi:aryl-alcohol dehydrogenase-like predicted oxidoreductase
MKYLKLGSSDLEVSEIGFGCMSLKGEAADNHEIVNEALNAGINYFDTADLYDHGANEILIGNLLKPQRKQLILATKVGNRFREDGSGWDWMPSKAYILTSVNESLKRLQTDYIDLYQLHGGTLDDPIDDIIEAFEILKSEGKIRYYGISSIRPSVIREYVNRSNIVSVMTQYSLLDRRPEEFTLNYLKENNIGVLARGALAQGLLLDKAPKPYVDSTEEQVKTAAYAIADLSDENRNKARLALQYVLQNPSIAAAVVGFRTKAQLEDIISHQPLNLSAEDRKLLENTVAISHYKEHR